MQNDVNFNSLAYQIATILETLIQAALLCGDSDHAEGALNEARESVAILVDSIRDPELRQKFMSCALPTISGHRGQCGHVFIKHTTE
jgi:hypothetical protein